LEQIVNIAISVAGFFEGDARKTALWFETPNPMLGGVTPRDMIRHGRYDKLVNSAVQARDDHPQR
jgi:hypothetical protein